MSDAEPTHRETPPPAARRLTPEQREEIIRRLKLGKESDASIAREFGVTRQAIGPMRNRLLPPDKRKPERRRQCTKRLSEGQLRTLIDAVKETLPTDHGYEMLGAEHRSRWSDARISALSKKLLGIVPAQRVLKDVRKVADAKPGPDPDRPPDYPLPHDVRRLEPDLAADEEFVEYYLSPAAWKLKLREYEYQVREYEKEVAAREGRVSPPEPLPPVSAEFPPPPGQRVGRHRKSKGEPFTKPKRKKRR